MGYWSVYVSPEEERVLRKKIEKIAEKRRWSFSQTVAGLLREHLIEEKNRVSDEDSWSLLTTESFFSGYHERDAIYDSL